MRTSKFQIVIWKEGKYFVAQCLNVDVSSFGRTRREALKNIEEALELYFEDSKLKKVPRVEQPKVIAWQFQHA